MNGTTCDNGLCTTGETCQSGTCTGTPVTCTALDQCHTAGTCNPATGVCSNPNKMNGTTCDNGLCTTGETCQSGTCTGTPVTCTALDQCHTVGTCNPATGVCSNPNKTNGTTCDNGLCTTGETCQSGTCTGTPVTCTALDQCHTAGTCNPATGVCSNPNKTNGTTCDNGLCTTGETCQSGTCTGTPVTCTALDQCHTVGTCNPATGVCSNPNKTDGTTCDNGLCTTGETCQSGTCTGTPVTCTAPDQCHTVGTCNPATGVCSNPNKTDGTTCDNGLCTTGETCQTGACTGGTPVTCTADQCHAPGTCNPTTGCPGPKPDGTTCNDGAVCTQSETCQAGSCQASNAFPTVLNLPATDVGTLPGGTQVFAEEINASGQIVGGALDAGGQYRAYMRTGTAPMAALPITPPSFGAALNDAGVVTGTITLPNESHAFRYSVTGGLQDLGRGGRRVHRNGRTHSATRAHTHPTSTPAIKSPARSPMRARSAASATATVPTSRTSDPWRAA